MRLTQKFFTVILVIVMAPSAYAGKVELTTYYPSPTGEYSELKSNKLKVGSNATTPATIGVMNFGGITPTLPATDPSDGHDGDLYFRATDHVFRYFDGSGSGEWKSFGGGGTVYHATINNDWNADSENTIFWPVGATGIVSDASGNPLQISQDFSAGDYLIEFTAANASITNVDNHNVVITGWLQTPQLYILINNIVVSTQNVTLSNAGNFPLSFRYVAHFDTDGRRTINIKAFLQANTACSALFHLNGSKVLTVTQVQ